VKSFSSLRIKQIYVLKLVTPNTHKSNIVRHLSAAENAHAQACDCGSWQKNNGQPHSAKKWRIMLICYSFPDQLPLLPGKTSKKSQNSLF